MRKRAQIAGSVACAASLALLVAVIPTTAQAAVLEAGAAGTAESSAQYALEFGDPDPEPEHPEPEDQAVLEDPAGWPWWVWALVLVGLVAIGVPIALFLMRRVREMRSDAERME